MASRTMPAIFGITVCFFLVCIVNTTTAQMTTGNHSETSEKSQVSTATLSAETTLSPNFIVTNTTTLSPNFNVTNTTTLSPNFNVTNTTTLSPNFNVTNTTTLSPNFNVTNTTLSNEKTTPLNVSELSQFSTSTAAPTTQSTVNVSGSSTLKAIATSSSSNSSSTMPLTGHSTSSNNQTYSTKTSGVTRVVSTTLPTQTKPTPQYNGTETTSNGTASTEMSDKTSMKYSEIILTSIFSAILVVVVLVILSFGFKRCLRGSFQYSHHPLRETYEPADSYSPPDDTLVISGGLYDAPRIYNPNMTVLEEEESQNDYASFNSRSGHLRLEFLPGDKDMDPVFNGSQTRNV